MRKIHLGKALENKNWDEIKADLNKLPIEGVNGNSSKEVIVEMLAKHGISMKNNSAVSVEIWGSGKPMREFLWSEDLAKACLFLMEEVNFTDLTGKEEGLSTEIRNTHINIGTGKEVSIKELAQIIRQIIGFKGSLVFNTDKSDGTMRKLTHVGKLNSLGWKHQVELHEGLMLMYEGFLL